MPLHNPDNLNTVVETTGTYLLTGGEVVYSGTGYTFNVLGGRGVIDGRGVSWSAQDVTLDPAHALLDRIDAFVVDAAGVVSAVTGTPSISPNKPSVDPALYLELSWALVVANTTEPPNTVSLYLYRENLGAPGEWVGSTSHPAQIVFDSAVNPRAGTVCIRATNAPAGATITLTAAAALDPRAYDLAVLFIRLTSAWGNKASLICQFKLGTANVGNPVILKPGQNGLLNDSASYQGQAWLTPEFAFPVGATIDRLVITVTGQTVSFGLDDLQLQYYGSDVLLPPDDDPNLHIRNVVVSMPVSATGVVLGDMVWQLAGEVVSWHMVADQPGAVKIDVWRTTYTLFDNAAHPVDADSICNGHEPEITGPGGNKAEDTDLSDWARRVVAPGDIWRFYVDSVTGITFVTLALVVQV